jgi:hypothetical protein
MREILKNQERRKEFRFQYGEKEKQLICYLETERGVTVEAFSKMAAIPTKVASRTLVLLTLCNVLSILPGDGQDVFVLSEAFRAGQRINAES